MSLVKNLPTRWWKGWGGKPDKGSIDKKPSNQWRRLERKTRQKINQWKTSQPMKKTGEENRKIMRYKYYRWKNLLTWIEDRKGKTEIDREGSRLMERGGVCLRRDLDDKELGQSKVLCSSSKVELPMVNDHTDFPALSVPGKQISGYPPASSSSRTTLIQTPPYCLFLVVLLGASISAS